MRKIALALGAVGAIAVCSPAVASGGAILVKAGQTVHLPCNVTGAIDIAAGGSVYSDCGGQTSIGGSVDVRPGGFIELCQAHIAGSLLARRAAAGSNIEHTTIVRTTTMGPSASVRSGPAAPDPLRGCGPGRPAGERAIRRLSSTPARSASGASPDR